MIYLFFLPDCVLSVCLGGGGGCNRIRGWCLCVSWPMLLSISVTFSYPVFLVLSALPFSVASYVSLRRNRGTKVCSFFSSLLGSALSIPVLCLLFLFLLQVPLASFFVVFFPLRSLIFSGFIARDYQASLQLKWLQSHYCQKLLLRKKISKNGVV